MCLGGLKAVDKMEKHWTAIGLDLWTSTFWEITVSSTPKKYIKQQKMQGGQQQLGGQV